MANSRAFGHANFLSFFIAKPTNLGSTVGYAFCFFQNQGDAWQIEMDPIQRQLNAKPLDCGLGSIFRSFAIVQDLDVDTTTLLDSMHKEVDAKSNNLGFGFGSFSILHNIGDT